LDWLQNCTIGTPAANILFHSSDLTKYRLAQAIGVPLKQIGEIVSAKRAAGFQR